MPLCLRCLCPIALLSFIGVCAFGQNSPHKEASQNADALRVHTAQLPLAFEQNTGQASADTDFLVRSGQMQADISSTHIRLSVPPLKGQREQLEICLEGARRGAEPKPTDRLPGESNYLMGPNPTAWRLHVPQYGRVEYSDIYRGIDLAYYGNRDRMEHDFVVHPGADPSEIHLDFDGERAVHLEKEGNLQIALESGAITLRRPHAYQMIDGQQREVRARFVLRNKRVGFDLDTYDHKQTLVIDPVLDYSTFLGNASIAVAGVATDAAGDTYITGEAPVAYPATANSVTCTNCVTPTNKLAVFVTKLNPTATAVIYSTFIGGSTDPYNNASIDQSSALTVDANGDAIVTGFTTSTDFPLKNPIPAGTPSFDDGFLVSLTPDGSGFNFSSRLGGSSSGSSAASVYPGAVTTDSAGNVYVAGSSQSPYLPVTSGTLDAFTPSYANSGAFLLKLSPAGALGYGAVVGAIGEASGGTGPAGLAVDNTGVVYMAGTAGQTIGTTNTPWPTTSGVYQSALISPSQNAPFVTRISADGSTILSSTLVGSGSVTGVALTPSHDVLITGSAGYNFPVTSDAYQNNAATSANGVITGGADGFFAKVSQDGTQLLYSSVFGPNGSNIFIHAIQQDPSGNVWIAGTTDGSLPTLVHPLQSVFTGFGQGGEGFVAEFDSPMHNLLFSSYVDGVNNSSQVNGLAIDSNGLAHVAGIASQTFPTSPGVVVPTVQPPPPGYTYAYGYAALIDASKPGGSVCFANVKGAAAQLGTSANGSFDIVNCGDGPLTISSTQLTSSVFAFSSSNTCTGAIAAGSSCTLNYTFTPAAMGSVSATVTIVSDAPMAANAATISGIGTAPVVYLVQNSLTFQPIVLGTTVQPATLLLENKGTAPLIVDMTQTNATAPFSIVSTTCGGSVAPSAFCTFSIAFNPSSAGNATGTLTIYTNDPKTPSVTASLSASALASYPVPTITSLSPPTLSLDGGTASVHVNGTNFFPATTVQINGITFPVTTQSSTVLNVSVDPSTIGVVGEFPVQVFNPSPGGASNTVTLTTYHVLNLTATNLVYEPHSGLLYAAIPAASATNANTILPINPATEALGTPIAVQANPTRLALSDDGQYLYVGFFAVQPSTSGSLQRINLTTGAVDRTFPLPGSSNGIIDMHVVPGSPQLLVASLNREGSPSENGVALFNDSGLVQYLPFGAAPDFYSLDSFTFTSDPTTFYGYPAGASFFNIGTVSSSGITPVSPGGASCCNQASGSKMVSDGALLYTNSGEVWDPKAKTLLGTYPGNLFYEPDVVADPAAKRTFILQNSFPTGPSEVVEDPAVASYNPSNFTLAGMVYFQLTDAPSSLERWGIDGFAFLNGLTGASFSAPGSASQLVVFRSSLATPNATSPVTLSATSLNFALQPVGIASPAQTLTLTNSGSATLTGLSVSVIGTNASSFSGNSACGTSLTPGGSCTISVVFTPAAGGSAVATLQISNSAIDSPQNVTLTGTAAAPSFTLSSQSLSFNSLPEGSSAQQTVTITNSGTVPLTSVATSVSGTNAADYTATTNCGASVAPAATCTITATFKPSTTGSESATLTVSASGVGSQMITLSGTGTAPDFVLPPPTGSSSATVPAGQPASFTFSVSQSGTFSGTVSMSCSNLPAYATCTFTPSTFTLGSAPTAVTLSIGTEQTVQAKLRPENGNEPLHPIQWAIFLLVVPATSRRLRRRLGSRRLAMLFVVSCAGAFALNGCSSGSGGGSTGPTIEKTPPGSYTVTVTATSESLSHSTPITLIVQ